MLCREQKLPLDLRLLVDAYTAWLHLWARVAGLNLGEYLWYTLFAFGSGRVREIMAIGGKRLDAWARGVFGRGSLRSTQRWYTARVRKVYIAANAGGIFGGGERLLMVRA